MTDRIYVAKCNFHISTPEGERFVHKGKTIREGHPLFRGHEAMFEELVVDFEVKAAGSGGVEEASANPGQVRRPGRPKLPRDAEGNIIHRESE